LLDRVRGKLDARQDKAVLRLFAAGPEGFTGRLNADNYPSPTATYNANDSYCVIDRDSLSFVSQ